ncbi:MAG: tRNA (guanosine(37)-N1)-methyltransferase TrmD [Candidatus Vogelbacteria bacterium]|nr:tRNA (guanosine(37)-N1)-methyltransferase TrmD [Candidatus Vogelbacteria bacterium]
MVTFHIVTIFPEMFTGYLGESMIARAVKGKKIAVKIYNLRDFTVDKHQHVDFKPYGGGPGMVFKPEPLIKAIDKIIKNKKKVKVVLFAPGGKSFTNPLAKTYAQKFDHIVLVAGRYEGIDARIKKIFKAEELSIGPYILTGGELPAMIVVDAVARQIKGVLGKEESLEEGRPAGTEIYTRPEIVAYKGKKYKVPPILLSGDHKKIEEWKVAQIAKTTKTIKKTV